jgi:hypothetical protein
LHTAQPVSTLAQPVLRFALAIAVLVFVLPTSAVAANDLAATPVAPAPDATYAPSTSGTNVLAEFKTSIANAFNQLTSAQAAIEISNQPTLGQDGSLADDLRLSRGILQRRDSDPTSWYGSVSAGSWATTPGIYYFQYALTVYDAGVSLHSDQYPPSCPNQTYSCVYTSPIYTLTIATPRPATPPPTTTISDTVTSSVSLATALTKAKSYVKSHYKARRPSGVCRRVSRTHVICRVAWRNAKHKRVTRTIEVERDSDNGIVVQPA